MDAEFCLCGMTRVQEGIVRFVEGLHAVCRTLQQSMGQMTRTDDEAAAGTPEKISDFGGQGQLARHRVYASHNVLCEELTMQFLQSLDVESQRMKHRIDELAEEMTKLRESHSSMYQILTEKDNQLDAMLIENRQNGAIIEQQKHQAKMQVSLDVSCLLVS